jgi:hypothetical protein
MSAAPLSTKPVVRYKPHHDDIPMIGERAVVYALDHPRLGERLVTTSRVICSNPETGAFETINTIYTPN